MRSLEPVVRPNGAEVADNTGVPGLLSRCDPDRRQHLRVNPPAVLVEVDCPRLGVCALEAQRA